MARLPDLLPDSAAKPDRWAQFRGLPPWQVGGAILPLVLIVVGGLLGGLAGGAATMINLKIARSGLSSAVKALAMVGVVLAAAIVYLVAAALLSAALG
ncbi:hypothetical protein ABZ461_02215 [Actinacidiphila glaucinigra]|uniref:hypothetical protein n=1 Tax=Actinacidiphila glaucinigra TaxID=235986 RepID=UPI0033E7B7D2